MPPKSVFGDGVARKTSAPVQPSTAAKPQIFEASLGANGSVVRGQLLTQAQAEASRQAGQDVVVCGPNLSSNRAFAQAIERNANGTAVRCPPHANAGPQALPHYQPQ